MTITLPLSLAKWPLETPSTAEPSPHKPGTSKTQKRRTTPKSATANRKAPSARATEQPPVYDAFGTLSLNPVYDLARVGQAIRQARNVIVISGAGVSTPAIPDFRSSRGLFKTLGDEVMRREMYGLGGDDEGEEEDTSGSRRRDLQNAGSGVSLSNKGGMKSGKDLFDVKCLTSPDLLPHHHNLLNHLTLLTSRTSPTSFHHYLKTLDDQGRLLRCYTQNIDGLEQKAGLDLRIPVEQDFPKRRRTGMSRESSRKSDVFGKKEGQVSLQVLPEDCGAQLQPKEILGTSSEAQFVRPVSVPISRLLNDANDYNPYQHPTAYQSPTYPYAPAFPPHALQNLASSTQTAADGFEVDPGFAFSSVAGERPYAAESDPFCQPQSLSESLDRPAGCSRASDLATTTSQIDSNILSVMAGSPAVRGTSAARSVSGTTDTSATSVSGKIGGAPDTDIDRDTEKEAKAAQTTDRLPAPASQPQSGPVEGPKLPRCVPLHGTLANLECTRCSYSQPLRDAIPLPPELMPCPSCEDEWEERVESSQRPRSIGFLRASVLLYGEEHRHGDSIGAVVERDLLGRLKDERMDLLIVAGTTLQIPGVKRMIKEFAKALRTQPTTKKKTSRKTGVAGDQAMDKDVSSAGPSRSRTTTSGEADDNDQDDFPIQTILLNRDPPGKGKGGEWANTFDVWVQGDLQEFVRQWVVDGPSPEEVAQQSSASQKLPSTAVPLFALSPNTQRRIEVTKVEGTKILLSLEKATPADASDRPTQVKRKDPPSPEKTTIKGKARARAKKAKQSSGISFPRTKPGVRASPPRKLQPSSPDSLGSGSDVCVLIPTPAARPVVASPPRRKLGKNRSGKQQAAPPVPAPAPQPRTPQRTKPVRPVKPRAAPTRRSARQSNAISHALSTLPPLTPRKRTYGSTCSSPLTSVPNSDDDSEECSSQGMIDGEL